MSKIWILGLGLIILLIPFFLISIGTTGDTPALWWIGLILLGIGGLIPPITRYAYAD
ncbi:MAG: hypothetical protein WD038_00625 [Balneolales bacterium]